MNENLSENNEDIWSEVCSYFSKFLTSRYGDVTQFLLGMPVHFYLYNIINQISCKWQIITAVVAQRETMRRCRDRNLNLGECDGGGCRIVHRERFKLLMNRHISPITNNLSTCMMLQWTHMCRVVFILRYEFRHTSSSHEHPCTPTPLESFYCSRAPHTLPSPC